MKPKLETESIEIKDKTNIKNPSINFTNNFKGFHLFVNGNRINAAIKDMRLAQEG